MKAIVMTAVGGPEVLQAHDISKPETCAGNEVIVKLKAAGVNPVDTKLRSKGTYRPDASPTVLGCDGAGVIEIVGKNIKDFKPGDEVWYCYGGIGGPRGNYAEYAVVDANTLALKPKNFSFEESAALPLVLITAWEALHDRARMQTGQTVLIHAGAGGVGHVAIQLAKAAGCKVITTVSDEHKGKLVKMFGADEVINYKKEDVVKRTLELTHNQGVDIAFDTVGGKTFQQTFPAIKPYGDIVTILQPDFDCDWKIARMRNLRISLELMLSPMYYGWDDALKHQGWIMQQCTQLANAGKLKPHVSQRFTLVEAAKAHHLIEVGGMLGKTVLTIV
ncbi:MAG TPA: zinc-dependent alcohol dehydrogenase family protein [Gammaproteobacteria bacterium]